MTLTYAASGTWHKSSCLGVAFPNALEKGSRWTLRRDSTGEIWRHITSAGNTLTASFLFEVPPNISAVSLVYKGTTVLKELPLPWK